MNPSQSERLARLRLIRSETIGPITFRKLLSRFGSASQTLEALPTLIKKGKRPNNPPFICSQDQAEDELAQLDGIGGHMMIWGDDNYPELLSMVEDAPPVLSVLGDPALLSKPCVGIVGARNASTNARRMAGQLAGTLGVNGQIIVSGLARGIDTAVHEASLDTGTIAVLAGGIDQVYPQENTDLYTAISDQGCIISEVPFGTAPTSRHFPKRNRIISGLSRGTIIVEATLKSGSLITARMAADQGRDVFAVPGFPGDPRAEGPNALIRDGAILVTGAEDVLRELSQFKQPAQRQDSLFKGISEPDFDYDLNDNKIPSAPHNIYDYLMNELSGAPLTVDDLIRSCQFSAHHVQTTLLEMELAGDITRHPGNRVSKVI